MYSMENSLELLTLLFFVNSIQKVNFSYKVNVN